MVSLAKSFVPRPSSLNASDPSSFTPSLSTPSRLQDEYDHMRQILAITFAVEIAFPFIFLIISFFTTIATILIAAVSSTGNTLSIKEFFSRVAGTWPKPFLTNIYISIHSLGFLPVLVIFAVPVFMYPNIVTALIAIFLAIVVFLFYLYLVAKGQRLKGYMLTLFFFLLNLLIALVYLKISGNTMPSSSIVYGLLLEILAPLVSIYQMMAYTVLYFRCKKKHGEETEIGVGVAQVYFAAHNLSC